MGKLIVTEFVTIDGVFEDPGGSEGTLHGGWQLPLMGDDEAEYKLDELRAADALLLGRVTYEGFAEAWPNMPDAGEFGDLMNGLPKHVASLTVSEFKWRNSSGLDSDVIAATRKLKEQYKRNILVMGSGELTRSLLKEGLVDELRLMTYPIILGSGRRLLDGATRTKMKFVSEQTFQNGTALLTYAQNT
jgi:dihydrofolate reductase